MFQKIVEMYSIQSADLHSIPIQGQGLQCTRIFNPLVLILSIGPWIFFLVAMAPVPSNGLSQPGKIHSEYFPFSFLFQIFNLK
jgi:hypothetical protein